MGSPLVGLTNGKASYLLLCDQVGTPLALATPDGTIVQLMRYDSFGNLLEQRGDVVRLPLGFAGGLFDRDTGLTRFVWRDYDADTGRFTALDPLREKGGDTDFYGYCVDDPVNRVDVWGLEWGWDDLVSYGSTFATEALRQAKFISTKVANGIGLITAPLGDMLDPTPVNDVYEETKEYWDKWDKPTEPEDLRSRH